MDIVVVSLNPSIDWHLTTPAFVYGGLNRVEVGERYASGKGINVCAALKNLGLDPLCMGFNFQENGALITDALDEWGVGHDFITVEGAVRTNIKLYDNEGTMTELNQPGAFVPMEALSRLYDKIKAIAADDSILVLSGSMPPGVEVDAYQKLCELWPGPVILDTGGEALKLAIAGDKPPVCIKPNRFELEYTFKVELPTKEDIAAFCRELLQTYGMQYICTSLGAKGAVLTTRTAAYYMPGLELPVKGVQGAGDAMVAALAFGLTIDAPEEKLLRMASAAAGASVIREGSLMCNAADFIIFMVEMPVVEKLLY